MNTQFKYPPHQYQSGMATLLITVLIILAMTLGSFSMIYSSTMEKRMNSNDLKSRQALQAAQSGIDYFMASLSGTEIDLEVVCAEDTLERFGFALNFTGPDSNGVLNFDPAVQLEECNRLPFGIMTRTSIWSRGFDENRESSRTILSTVDLTASWNFFQRRFASVTDDDENPFKGKLPITAKGNVTVGASTNVQICELSLCERAATSGNPKRFFDGTPDMVLIESGGTAVVEQGQGNTPDWKLTNDNVSSGVQELVDMDADEYFATYFGNGNTKAEFIEQAYTLGANETLNNQIMDRYTNIYIPANHPSLGTGNALTIDSGNRSETTYGSSARQINLFVEANVNIQGNGVIWANIYTTQNFTGAGNGKYMGRVISEQSVNWGGNVSVLAPDVAPNIRPPGGDGDDDNAEDFDQSVYAQLRSTTIRIGSWREIVK